MKDAYNPHGEALLDYADGNHAATLIYWQDGVRDDVPAAVCFREHIDPLESDALDLCGGRVLDLGAGTGVHTLRLVTRGLDVTALDIAPQCVEIMRRRAVRRPVAGDCYTFEAVPFDTILAICDGLEKSAGSPICRAFCLGVFRGCLEGWADAQRFNSVADRKHFAVHTFCSVASRLSLIPVDNLNCTNVKKRHPSRHCCCRASHRRIDLAGLCGLRGFKIPRGLGSADGIGCLLLRRGRLSRGRARHCSMRPKVRSWIYCGS